LYFAWRIMPFYALIFSFFSLLKGLNLVVFRSNRILCKAASSNKAINSGSQKCRSALVTAGYGKR